MQQLGHYKERTGLVFAVLSCAAFGTSGTFATSLFAAGWSPGAVVTARVGLAAVVLTLPALLQLRQRRPRPAAMRAIALYGLVAVAGAQLCYFSAVAHLSVAVALLLEYSGILLVVGWGWARHGHRPRRLTVIGGLAALAGLVLVLGLLGSHRLDLAGVLWALGAAVGLAAYFILSAHADESAPPLVVAWGGLTAGGLALGAAGLAGVLPVRFALTDAILLDRPVAWAVPVVGLVIVAAVIAYLFGISSVRRLGSKLASFVGLSEVLFAVAFAWLLLGQRLDWTQLAGGALVVAGIALVRLDELREDEPAVWPAEVAA